MAKKNNKRKRKRKPLKANSKRQAHAQLKGYLYQIWHSVNAWLDLADDEVLYLEGAEDFDILSDSIDTAVQVKSTQRNITLSSQTVNDAINNFWELKADNPDRRLKFRFLTTSKIGKETRSSFGKGHSGLEVWSRCSGDETVIVKISEFLQTEGKISAEVNDFLKVSSPQDIYEQLIEPITWETESKPASYVEQSIREKLVHHGDRYDILAYDAKKVVDSLLKEAWTVATQKEDRVLTRERFLEIFEKKTMRMVPGHQWQQFQQMLNTRRSLGAEFIGDSPDITIQTHPPILTSIPPLYPNVIQRTDLLTRIQTKLQSNSIAIIHGGTGKGKTTLAKLTANAIDGNWFWLNFTNKEASHIVQDLQQLADAVSRRSGQVNVILDNLNLQQQQLQAYEGALGVVVYRILERGAKLLITSQYQPPHNLIRRLGVSPSLVINIPNFTGSEIGQFAEQLGCPTHEVNTFVTHIQSHTKGHPMLVHAQLAQLQEEGWQKQDTTESFSQAPRSVEEEREAARQLLMNLPEDQREFLYRLSMLTEFRKDYAINIGDIPEPIPHPGLVFKQLVGPWIDQVGEIYYTISPLLMDAAKEDLSESKRRDLHAHIANEIFKTRELSTIEARSVFLHSARGRNKGSLIAIIEAILTAPENVWKALCQEFSRLIHVKEDLPEELFPGDALVNYSIRFLQYRIAAEVEPEFAPKILEIWDRETKPHEPHQIYLSSRLTLAIQVVRCNQVSLPAKKLIGYVKEIIDIAKDNKDLREKFLHSTGQLKKYSVSKSNIFGILFTFIHTRDNISARFLSDLIDALDELQPEIRTLVLANFVDETIESRILIDGIWLAEANLENPNWTRCLEVYDKVIERTIAWDYPYIAAAAARGKTIIYNEYLHDPDTAHKVLQDILSKVDPSPVIEGELAWLRFCQKRYKEALHIYERILPQWNPLSGQSDFTPSEGCRRAAICAAHLGNWDKAAAFFQDGAKRTQKDENTERHIGLYADAGFAHFKAGNMLGSIKLLHLALQKFEKLPQDDTNLKYFTLKQNLALTLDWMARHDSDEYTSEFEKLFEKLLIGLCSDSGTNEKILNLPDSPIECAWLALARIEYKFGHSMTALEHALQITDRKAYPRLRGNLYFLKIQYDFKNKTFDNLPQHIYQLANICGLIQERNQGRRRIGNEEINALPIPNLPNSVDVGTLTIMLVAALLTQLSKNKDVHEILPIWRANSSELPIKENVLTVLDLIEAMLSGDQNNALTVMNTIWTGTPEAKSGEWIVAALKVVENKETTPEDLLYGHIFITMCFIGQISEEFVVSDLAKLLSAQWLEKIRSGAISQTPVNIIQQITQACNSNETGKKKIGQILLAVSQAIPIKVLSTTEILQEFRGWIESKPKQKCDPKNEKNPIIQHFIKTMEKYPHLTDEDIDALNQSIEEGKIPIKFNSPFDLDDEKKQ